MSTSIDAMPAGREMDALVAEKVMGAKWDEKRCRVCGWPLDPEGGLCRPDDCSERPQRKGDGRADAHAFYSTDITAAWLVVERMREMGYALDSWSSGNGDTDHPWTDAIFVKELDETLCREKTFPLAICRAALKAVGA